MKLIDKTLLEDALKDIEMISDEKSLQEVHLKWMSKNSEVSKLMMKMKDIAPENKAAYGQEVNDLKNAIQTAYDAKKEILEQKALEEKIKNESVDITLPGFDFSKGSLHPLTSIVNQVTELFENMGYSVVDGPEVESDLMNFEKLNIPKDHPARDMQDTFYIDAETLMRTHTSPVQARTMEKANGQGPIKVIVPGKVYRRDDDDATHSHQFMQIEVLNVGKDISMADLKVTLLDLARHMFGPDKQIRMRPSYFPFTEPSTEVDVTCHKCGGKGCNVCKGTGWIEILGAGMVHPNVLTACGFDASVYRGFAIGMGVERLAMLKYGVADIRDFYTNDVRFLKQFRREK